MRGVQVAKSLEAVVRAGSAVASGHQELAVLFRQVDPVLRLKPFQPSRSEPGPQAIPVCVRSVDEELRVGLTQLVQLFQQTFDPARHSFIRPGLGLLPCHRLISSDALGGRTNKLTCRWADEPWVMSSRQARWSGAATGSDVATDSAESEPACRAASSGW